MDIHEVKKLELYLRRQFSNQRIRVVPRPKKDDSAEVYVGDDFKAFGLDLTKFVIENVSLPAEVEAAMDKRTSMGVIGDVGRYAQFQAADAMRDAAQNTGGGGAATGAGLGAGLDAAIGGEAW